MSDTAGKLFEGIKKEANARLPDDLKHIEVAKITEKAESAMKLFKVLLMANAQEMYPDGIKDFKKVSLDLKIGEVFFEKVVGALKGEQDSGYLKEDFTKKLSSVLDTLGNLSSTLDSEDNSQNGSYGNMEKELGAYFKEFDNMPTPSVKPLAGNVKAVIENTLKDIGKARGEGVFEGIEPSQSPGK